MTNLFLARTFAYSILPLLLVAAHLLLDRSSRTPARRLEIVLLYLFAISVGANGLGGAFGHLFLSDLVAEGVGWPAGSPFQLEMGFANLLIGVLGILAIGRRDGFRLATIVATTILGAGATAVHLYDIALTGNLAPGNTLINISNLLDPILLILLSWLAARLADPDAESPAFLQWQVRQRPIVGLAAAGIGSGFGLGFALGGIYLWTLLGALAGAGLGMFISRQQSGSAGDLALS